MSSETLKTRLRAGQVAIGAWLTTSSAEVAEIMAAQGFDWLAVDMEHGSAGVNEAFGAFRAAERWGVVPFARLPSSDPFLARRLLDGGAQGVIVPVVEDADDFADFAQHLLYPPNGRRGVGLGRCNLWGAEFESYLTRFSPIMVAQIETKKGVCAAAAIAALPEVDALFLGPYDLSASLGAAGDFQTADFLEAVATVKCACERHGKALGIHQVAPVASELEARIAEGNRFIAYGTDALALRHALAAVSSRRRADPETTMKTICVIPARMASSRFPNKPLAPLLGLSLVLHVWERCRLARCFDDIVVATCDEDIAAAVRAKGGKAVMTADTHPGCVDRTVECIDNMDLGLAEDDLVLMVQGDEVMVTPAMLEEMAEAYKRTKVPVVNLACVISDAADYDDPNVVKVCADLHGRALFFSRTPIPSRSRAKGAVPMYQQTGVIAFSYSFLKAFGRLERTPLEKAEQVDMLRTLEHGYPIQLVMTQSRLLGVDVPGDIGRGEALLRMDPTTRAYMELPG